MRRGLNVFTRNCSVKSDQRCDDTYKVSPLRRHIYHSICLYLIWRGRNWLLAIHISKIEPLRKTETTPTYASYFMYSRSCLGASLTSNPLEQPFPRMFSFHYEAAIGTMLTLSLLCYVRWSVVRRHWSRELITFSKQCFHSRPTHSLLWPSLFALLISSRKTLQMSCVIA